jgi:hypothetical protein
MDDGRDKLDRLIDGALASYPDGEPLAGLEQRVLNRARVARARRQWMFAWGVGLAVAASIVVVGIAIRSEHRAVEKPAAVARAARVEELTPRVQTAKVRPTKRVRRPKALPKLEQFPTPSPLTAEERALVALVQREPTEAQQIFSDLQKRTDGPIEIQPIQIAPLNDGAQ